jgi:hypothetical protein
MSAFVLSDERLRAFMSAFEETHSVGTSLVCCSVCSGSFSNPFAHLAKFHDRPTHRSHESVSKTDPHGMQTTPNCQRTETNHVCCMSISGEMSTFRRQSLRIFPHRHVIDLTEKPKALTLPSSPTAFHLNGQQRGFCQKQSAQMAHLDPHLALPGRRHRRSSGG